jgi:hypothetical protein
MGKYSPEETKRLDDRMAEMDRLRSDPTMKLVRTKSGKFQYVPKDPELKSLSYKKASISTEAPIKSLSYKDAAKSKSKPASRDNSTLKSYPYGVNDSREVTSVPSPYTRYPRGAEASNTPADTASSRAYDDVWYTYGPNVDYSRSARTWAEGTGKGGSIPTPKTKSVKSSKDLMERFKGLEEAEVPDSPVRSADELMKGYTGERGTRFKKGGKVGKVMGEFKSGALKSSSGQKVTNRKQAMAIAMSEAGKPKMKKFAAGGMSAPAPRNSIDQMKQAANLVKTVKSEAAKRGMIPARPMGGYGTAGLGRAAMGALRGMGGGTGTTSPLGNVGNAVAGVGKGMFGMKRGGKVGESKEMVEKEMAFMKKKGAPKSMMKHEKEEAKGMKKMAKGGMSCMKRGGGVEVKGYKKGGMIDGCAQRGKTKGKVC